MAKRRVAGADLRRGLLAARDRVAWADGARGNAGHRDGLAALREGARRHVVEDLHLPDGNLINTLAL